MIAVSREAGLSSDNLSFHAGLLSRLPGSTTYLTPRVSVRGSLGWTDSEVDLIPGARFRQIRIVGNVLYNWEGGAWHPFVTAGVGPYFPRLSDGGHPIGDLTTRAGLNIGGGIEYFSRRRITIKTEALYHIVGHNEFTDASGPTLTIGLKRYLDRTR
jgi:hypothetical protein